MYFKLILLVLINILICTQIKASKAVDSAIEDVFDVASNASHQNLGSNKLPTLLVFISLSIPKESLKQLADQVKKAKGVMILRGLHKGSFKETVKILHNLNSNGIPVMIHPRLFQKYNVTSVPTFVIADESNQCSQSESCTPIYDKIRGNNSLSYVLQQFKKEGHLITFASEHLKLLEGGND